MQLHRKGNENLHKGMATEMEKTDFASISKINHYHRCRSDVKSKDKECGQGASWVCDLAPFK